MYDEEKAKSNPQTKVGSEFFNDLTGLLGNHTMKIGATFHRCDVKTKDIFKESDVAGYNYGILRYKKDLKKYRERFILGSETFCEDAYKFYNMALDNPRLIGDFVWAGMDYLGEVGIGSWEYKDYAPNFKHVSGWISAGSGRVNLIGSELCEALYTKAAFNLTNVPEIGVVPINHTNDKHSPSAWKFSNAVNSLRKKSGYSQEELALKLGVSRQAVSKWERAEASPDTDNLIMLSKLYNVSLDDIISDEDIINTVKEDYIDDEEEEEESIAKKEDKSFIKKIAIVRSSLYLLSVTIFLTIGLMTGIWHPTWTVFLLPGVIASLISAIHFKKPNRFLYPLLVVTIYMVFSTIYNIYHPLWVIFITVPIYYSICELLKK